MTDRYQVVVVGGGPVGVALGVELAQRGIACAVVERNAELQDIPKGQMLSGRTMEHFYFWHCVEQLRGARLLPAGHTIGTITLYENLHSGYFYGMSVAATANPDLYFQTRERLPQYETERVLRERLAQLPTATAMYGMTATRMKQDADGVQIAVVPTQRSAGRFHGWESSVEEQAAVTGEERVLYADYAVGCDGARSLIRDSAGIKRSGRDYGKKMMLVVFRSSELHERLADLPEATTYRVMRTELAGWWQFFGRIDLGEGFFFHAPVPTEAQTDTLDVLLVLQQAAGFPFSAEIDRVGFWEGRIMLASEYRRGRIFIAGDAAHQHPPYGAYGLNTGLEDATNLGWKLAATLEGWGGETLLDSYEQERRPVFADVGELIAAGIGADRAFLERYDPKRDRSEFERAWRDLEHEESAFRFQREPCYADSELVCGAGDGRSGAIVPSSHQARAGHHLSPHTLSTGTNVFTSLGDGFTLIALDADGPAVEGFVAAARSLGMPLKVIRDSLDGERIAYAARLILVRPDQYVAWSGNRAPDDPADLLALVSGRRALRTA